MAETDRDTRRHPARAYLWALGLLWLLPAVIVGFGYLVSPKDLPDGQCEGIGFGCSLSPADGVLLMGVLASPILFSAGLVAIFVITVVRNRQRPDAS